ncbi:MerR family transcriptional regulator [Streptomyces sp. SID13726]|uniref:MerR family transcriptional regulator n=1 Tax=Streptomyces sp. SID13726 TaxID=2706058 RepID=UPI0013BA55D0|nr:MerR family transcriptional regulator [Streptomyces sp. SID13726]NEB05755.1 MerR family transcriptional regulator [Streptomyces sp. SID13726]
MIEDGTALFTIGELARATGLTVRTIRYWSDEGVLHPVARSTGGYRLYDTEAAARLELIRTLRELGLGLDVVREVVEGEKNLASVAAAHVAALDARIASLKVTRAVLSTVARRGSTAEEMTLMHKLARLSAAERRRIMEEFVAETFHGLDLADPDVRDRMRDSALNLPDDPTPEQVDAWVELAELVRDPEFRALMRRAAEFNSADRESGTSPGAAMGFFERLVRLVGRARADGIAPEAPEAEAVLRELLGDADRAGVLDRMKATHNTGLARYRELMGILKGAPLPAHEQDFAWVVAALEAGAGR